MSHGLACLLGRAGELIAIEAFLGDLVCHDQVMLGIDRRLHVVADDARTTTVRGHGACIGISQRELLVRLLAHALAQSAELLHLLAHRGELLREMPDTRFW